ncbi:MAG: family 43 glycosylhydrolase [Candidatus Hodarchaeota archaeon]
MPPNFPTSIINFRPAMPCHLADINPFYWEGDYHAFYFGNFSDTGKWGWHHVVSNDLVHWRELPPAVRPGDKRTDPDYEGCWSGSIIEHDGVFYLFYTGKNSQDPKGDQKVMCATSEDLIIWTKKPEMTFYADGNIYWSKPVNGPIDQVIEHHRAFRDPQLLWNDNASEWSFVLHACSAQDPEGVIGHYTSQNLTDWEPQDLLFKPGGGYSLDCPQMIFLNNKWYIISASLEYISANSTYGPYSTIPQRYGYGTLEVPKAVYDGERHVLIGWLWDRKGFRDEGVQVWGGTMAMAREIYAGDDEKLYLRPVQEVIDYFGRPILELKDKPVPTVASGSWEYINGSLNVSKEYSGSAHGSFEVPADYMLHARVKMPALGTVTVGFREQLGNVDTGYKLILSPETGEIILSDLGNYVHKMPASLDYDEPVDIRVFVMNNIIECFVNDAYNLGIRAYNFGEGLLSFDCSCEGIAIQALEVKVP